MLVVLILKIDYDSNNCTASGQTIQEVRDDNNRLEVVGVYFYGEVPTIEPKITEDFKTVLKWSEKSKKIGIRANADTPEAARLARQYGAQGIGLCRTERMFNAKDRIGYYLLK